jgi:hypothetical protein
MILPKTEHLCYISSSLVLPCAQTASCWIGTCHAQYPASLGLPCFSSSSQRAICNPSHSIPLRSFDMNSATTASYATPIRSAHLQKKVTLIRVLAPEFLLSPILNDEDTTLCPVERRIVPDYFGTHFDSPTFPPLEPLAPLAPLNLAPASCLTEVLRRLEAV